MDEMRERMESNQSIKRWDWRKVCERNEGMEWKQIQLINGINLIDGIEQMNAAQWNGWVKRRTKQPNAARQANSKSNQTNFIVFVWWIWWRRREAKLSWAARGALIFLFVGYGWGPSPLPQRNSIPSINKS